MKRSSIPRAVTPALPRGVHAAAIRSAAQDTVVIPPLRPDLIVTKQFFEGRTFYVVTDPVSLQCFRLTAEDYFLATLFDGKRDLRAVRELYLARFPHLRLAHSAEELKRRVVRFASDLGLLQFLRAQGSRLEARREVRRAPQTRGPGRIFQAIKSLLFRRFLLGDPDRLFARMARPLWWIWTKTTLWVSAVLIALAALTIVNRYDATAGMMAGFFSLNNLVLLWVLAILIKSIHELGHGLACKHFGGAVREAGVRFMVFTPYFFVNVSDRWVMPGRNKRIVVPATGICVELILAALATLFWATAQPGLLQQVLWNIIVLCSVSTLVFNANPLLRFDGYHILTGLIGVPHLQAKSRTFIAQWVKRCLFGRDELSAATAPLALPKWRLGFFGFYAIASYLYGAFVLCGLMIYLAPQLEPVGLGQLAVWFSMAGLLAWVVMPFVDFMKSLALTREDAKPGGRWRRLAFAGGVGLAAFAVLCFLPKQPTIQRGITVVLADPEAVRPEVEGLIREIYVKEGDRVAPGTPLAQLSNREIEQEFAQAQRQVEIAALGLHRALAEDKPAQRREAETAKARAEKSLEEAAKKRDALTLRAERGGTVLTRDLHRKLNQGLRLSELFCEIAPVESMRIRIPLNEREARNVRKDQPVELVTYAYPDRPLTGRVAANPLPVAGANTPAALSAQRAGDEPAALDRERREVPLGHTFEAHIEVDNRDRRLRPGMTGRTKIVAGTSPWGQLMWQSVRDLVISDHRF